MVYGNNTTLSTSPEWVRGFAAVILTLWTGMLWGESAAFEAMPRALNTDARQDPRWLKQLPPMQWPLPKPSLMTAAAKVLTPVTVPTANTAKNPEKTGQNAVSQSDADHLAPPLEVSPPSHLEPTDPGGQGVKEALAAQSEPPVTAPLAQPTVVCHGENGSETVQNGLPSTATSRCCWQVQVWAGRSLSLAKKYRAWSGDRYGNLLKGFQWKMETSARDPHDHFYKLRIVSMTDRRTAATLCSQIKSKGGQCIVVKILAARG